MWADGVRARLGCSSVAALPPSPGLLAPVPPSLACDGCAALLPGPPRDEDGRDVRKDCVAARAAKRRRATVDEDDDERLAEGREGGEERQLKGEAEREGEGGGCISVGRLQGRPRHTSA